MEWLCLSEKLSVRMLPTPKTVGIVCIGLAWEVGENLAIQLVYRLPNAPADSLLDLCIRLGAETLGLGDFYDDATSSQAMDLVLSMEALESFQFVSTATN